MEDAQQLIKQEMTLLTVGIAIVATGGAASPLVAAGMMGSTAPAATLTVATGAGVAATTATGTATIGAVAVGTNVALGAAANGAALVPAVGLGTSAGLAAAGTGVASTTGGAIVSAMVAAPAIPIIVGTDLYSFECWKPIVRNRSLKPSTGRYLHDLLNDEAISSWHYHTSTSNDAVPNVTINNVWGESFFLTPFEIDLGQGPIMTYHATRVR